METSFTNVKSGVKTGSSPQAKSPFHTKLKITAISRKAFIYKLPPK